MVEKGENPNQQPQDESQPKGESLMKLIKGAYPKWWSEEIGQKNSVNPLTEGGLITLLIADNYAILTSLYRHINNESDIADEIRPKLDDLISINDNETDFELLERHMVVANQFLETAAVYSEISEEVKTVVKSDLALYLNRLERLFGVKIIASDKEKNNGTVSIKMGEMGEHDLGVFYEEENQIIVNSYESVK
jgi:hypothetical protein